ncbi:MAG: aminomethyl-transferring glycine dehydrogenase [Opitutales bacterium]
MRESFAHRHIGPSEAESAEMLKALGYESLDTLSDAVVPENIRLDRLLDLPPAATEAAASAELREIAQRNRVWRSLIGQGYYGTVTPPVIQRTIFENPGWYTAYTPYQPEIAQGRLEALLNFQTLVTELSGLPVANASLLDEATAAAEAATLARAALRNKRNTLLVADHCHPQTLAVVQARAEPLSWNVVVAPVDELVPDEDTFAVIVQTPDTFGHCRAYPTVADKAHAAGALLIAGIDPLAHTLLPAPGAWGADVVYGSLQRFGVPMGYGGPHAAFLAVGDAHKRLLPGRLVGMTKDSNGQPALRLALQTREQHIRRDKATSNICTAQVLLAVMAGMYAVYHGPEGLQGIARRVHISASRLARALDAAGVPVTYAGENDFFDTLHLRPGTPENGGIRGRAESAEINLRYFADGAIGLSLDECTTEGELARLLEVLAPGATLPTAGNVSGKYESERETFLPQEVFHQYHTETEFMRYVRRLEMKDLTLANSMIPLGSCTMKLNAASELMPVSWPEFNQLHPYCPADQAEGYAEMVRQLESWLAEITGFAGVSLQPNAGAQGEYAGLLAIRGYLRDKGEAHRTVCLIPESAHGTNPASAVMAGFKVISVKCVNGGIDLDDLRAKAEKHADNLGALMLTYPSTYGVFEATVSDVCAIVHEHGGQVYLDGANMNAMVGLCRPGDFGADVCHLNLHKTFCIPHGGGGPGVGPIGMAAHLVPFGPGNPIADVAGPVGPVAAAPFGSASILPISWIYLRAMGPRGLRAATQTAILNANYIAHRLKGAYQLMYTGSNGLVAHEGILDTRPLKQSPGIEVDDIAKRLMDFGFHAPTMSWPVGGTLMIEPTESESKVELDRFCEAMLTIREEIAQIERGEADASDNVLKHAPHTVDILTADTWERPYARSQAAYPPGVTRERKFWPAVGRVDNVFGDKNLVCTCPSVEELAEA